MKPRRLKYLRLNDKPPASGFDLPTTRLPVDVTDLRFWFDQFCKNLANQEPWDFELLTIDFNFEHDTTGPWYPKKPDDPLTSQDFVDHVALRELRWPDTLISATRVSGPNSGLLIGNYLISIAAYRDLPSGIAIHTHYPGIVLRDMPSAMLVTQILLATEATPFTGELADTMRRALELVTVSVDKPLLGLGDAVARFRKSFLMRAGAIAAKQKTPVRLWVETTSLLDLLTIFRTVKTEEELDAKLGESGIEFYDRFGVLHCLDVRSVFLDALIDFDEEEHRLRNLLPHLPLAAVRPATAENPNAGAVWQFIDILATKSAANIEPVMEFFRRAKADKQTGNVNQIARPTHRLIALILAWIDLYADYWHKSESAPYDPVEDNFERLEFSPLALQIKELLRIISLAANEGWVVNHEPFDPRRHSMPIFGSHSVSALLTKFCDHESRLYRPLWGDGLQSATQRQRFTAGLEQLLEIAERWECLEGKRDRKGKLYIRLKWAEIPERRPAKIDQTQIGRILGFNVEEGRDPSNELNRIVRRAPGYEKESISEFLTNLEERPLPDYFKRLGWKFIDEFWGDRFPPEAWPICLSDMQSSSGGKITHAQWAAEMERSLADALRGIVDIVPAEFSLSVAGCEIYGKREFADQLGGDYYRAKAEQGNLIRLSIGDVVGKGVAASHIVHEIHALVTEYEARGFTCEEICSALGKRLIERPSDHGVIYATRNYPGNRWATFVCATLDLGSRRMSYVNAGHPSPLLVRANGSIMTLESQAAPLGILVESVYRAHTVELNPGDRIIFYTDGLCDKPDESMTQLVLQNRSLSPKALAEQVLLSVGERPAPADDVTIMVVAIP